MNCKICDNHTRPWIKKLFDDRHGCPGYFDVDRCRNCGFAQSKPQLSAKKISAIYKKYYPWHKTDLSKVRLEDHKKPDTFTIWRKGLFINGQYWIKPKSKVLDIGCGMGFSLLELKNADCIAYGVDPEPTAKKLAKKFKLNFKQGFIENNPFPEQKFDYIVANQVLEHTNNPADFLRTCKNRLSTNGKIILSFPNLNSLTRYLLGKNWLHWHVPYHLNFFTNKSINLLVKHIDLKIETIKTITPNMWSNLQLRRLLESPKMGKRDVFWDGKTKKDEPLKQGVFPKLINLTENYNILNRLIDLTGYGESFVVILSKV